MTSRPPHVPLVAPGQVDHHVADLTVTAGGTVTLRDLQATLAGHNQWLPIDGDPSATLGHLLSTNSTGPLRLGFGAWRDLLLGVQFTSGRGELVTAGGQTMKNVAGYDLTKFLVGSHGIFGEPVTLTIRTYKRPTSALLATFSPDVPILNSLLPTTARPHWTILTPDELLCGYVGDRDTIHFYLKDVRGHDPLEVRQQSFEDDEALRARLWRSQAADPELTFRASAPPARLDDLLRALKPSQWVADPAFGILLGTCPSKSHIHPWHSLASSVSARVSFHHPTSGALVHYSTTPGEQRIIEQLKRAFDPRGRLTPLPR